MADTFRYSAFIDSVHANRLKALRRKGSQAVSDKARELVGAGWSSVEARLEARRRCREQWPPLDVVVGRALEQRLSEPDLAGPWAPLTDAEEEFMSLSGRWPSKNYPGFLVKRAYDLPVDLLKRARTAAFRASEGPLAELDERGLTYNRLDLEEEERRIRDELLDKVYPVPRILRQGLARYGPWPHEDDLPAG
ncbi:hypothetical protein [Streptomyces sp. NPDC058751]|uniref:hypothetical protein n=1 Tax=Streptomyces sp. NPDC058751 TaxID=3346623 RepID=UPI0036ABA15E